LRRDPPALARRLRPRPEPGEPNPDPFHTNLCHHAIRLGGNVEARKTLSSVLAHIGASVKIESQQAVTDLVVLAAVIAATHGPSADPPGRAAHPRLAELGRLVRPISGPMKWAEHPDLDGDGIALEPFHLDRRDLGSLFSLVALGRDVSVGGDSHSFPGHRLRVTIS
jgi:hypothetical protein